MRCAQASDEATARITFSACAVVTGKRHGYGVYSYADGGRFEGEWIDDKVHGRGVSIYASGNRCVPVPVAAAASLMHWCRGEAYGMFPSPETDILAASGMRANGSMGRSMDRAPCGMLTVIAIRENGVTVRCVSLSVMQGLSCAPYAWWAWTCKTNQLCTGILFNVDGGRESAADADPCGHVAPSRTPRVLAYLRHVEFG